MASTSRRPLYVVDASVAVKWFLRDEPGIQLADSLLTDFRDGRIELLAPAHFRYEVPSAILNAVRSRRLKLAEGRASIVDFFGWQVPTVDDDTLVETGYDLAMRSGCTLYDGTCIALAEIVGCPLVHADRRLRNALGAGSSRAIWIEDYRSPA